VVRDSSEAPALATRFVPFRESGQWHLWPTLVVALVGAIAVGATFYIVIVLEILKLTRVRAWAGRGARQRMNKVRRFRLS
jgi:hypothetical protein